MAWYDHNWILAAVTLLSVTVVYRQLRLMSKRNEFDSLRRSNEIVASRFAKIEGGPSCLYDLRYRFKEKGDRSESRACNPDWGRAAYQKAIQARLTMVANLSDANRDADLTVVRPVVNALNDLAELVDLDFLEASRILSKYHVLLAREVFLVEPYIYYEVLFADRGRWGYRVLRLGEMARTYNDMNPVHRQSIYFLDGDRPDTDFGAIYVAPDSRFLWLYKPWWLVRRRFGYPTITERVKRRQNREFRKMESRTHHLRREPETKTARTATQEAGEAEST